MTKQTNKQKKKKSKSGKSRTPLTGHSHIGKELLPPFAQLNSKLGGKMVFSSWANERLPEMIWAGLIRAHVDQEHAIRLFRRILTYINRHEKHDLLSNITITGIAGLQPPLREELIKFILEPSEAAYALSSLKLFKSLPARDSWLKFLPDTQPDIELLMTAVGATLWHQSQEATDCRWLRIMAQVVTGKVKFPAELAETVKALYGYPNVGDQRHVRPTVRAFEMTPDSLDTVDMTWPNAFWDEAWHNTPCFTLADKVTAKPVQVVVTRQKVSEVYDSLMFHWKNSHATTAINARHDAVFGMTFYSIRILEELLGIGVGTGILGRLGIRTILEIHINLKYLLSQDDEALWKRWRTYGSGQAKLNALRFDDNVEPPKYIATENIEQIAGEDIWEEFLSISLGSWSGADLRKLSEKAGLKETYDKHYSWTSGYVHGTWGPVREACFQACGNPLHRLHRFPAERSLQDTVEEAAELVDEILNDLDRAYPTFLNRVTQKVANAEQGS